MKKFPLTSIAFVMDDALAPFSKRAMAAFHLCSIIAATSAGRPEWTALLRVGDVARIRCRPCTSSLMMATWTSRAVYACGELADDVVVCIVLAEGEGKPTVPAPAAAGGGRDRAASHRLRRVLAEDSLPVIKGSRLVTVAWSV